MKGKRTYHIVPLAIQALAILKELHAVTGEGRYLFPHFSDSAKTLSSNTITKALRSLGYTGDEMTDHGFRTVASTLLNEDEEGGWRPDAIDGSSRIRRTTKSAVRTTPPNTSRNVGG